MRSAKRALLVLLALYVIANIWRICDRKFYIWLPDYARWALAAKEKAKPPVHLFLLYSDHFEPGRSPESLRRWSRDFPGLADRHRDSTGRPAQHTWFYPGEQPLDAYMDVLRNLVARGYGEVELHYHHGNDTEDSAGRKFQDAVLYFQRWGFLKTIDGQTRFAFIHGNWALDNSEQAGVCGVNRELQLLRRLGCFADFTFPALWRPAQPSMVNSIYMAVDDSLPKSYDRGQPVRVGSRLDGDLMIFEGPLVIAPSPRVQRLFWEVEDGDIHPSIPVGPRRVDLWVKAGVHVEGKPEWVFIKVHGHSARSAEDLEETLGPRFERTLAYLESRYNDGVHYVLHYVTAREAYNLACAAADGQTGDPRKFYDWVVKPYVACPSRP